MTQAYNPKGADYNPRKINRWVPLMQYDAHVIHTGPTVVDLGTPAVAATNNILLTQAITTAGSTTTVLLDTMDAEFGRCLQVVCSGASTVAVSVTGRDYLGQPMKETFTLNGSTPVIGVKAFKWIDSVIWAAQSGETLTVGTTDKLGLPYKTLAVVREYMDKVAQSAGTFVAPNQSAGTATSTDPRGTYDPTTTLNGARRVLVEVAADRTDLLGLAHFFA